MHHSKTVNFLWNITNLIRRTTTSDLLVVDFKSRMIEHIEHPCEAGGSSDENRTKWED